MKTEFTKHLPYGGLQSQKLGVSPIVRINQRTSYHNISYMDSVILKKKGVW